MCGSKYDEDMRCVGGRGIPGVLPIFEGKTQAITALWRTNNTDDKNITMGCFEWWLEDMTATQYYRA